MILISMWVYKSGFTSKCNDHRDGGHVLNVVSGYVSWKSNGMFRVCFMFFDLPITLVCRKKNRLSCLGWESFKFLDVLICVLGSLGPKTRTVSEIEKSPPWHEIYYSTGSHTLSFRPCLKSSNVHELNKLIITSFDAFLMANKWTSITHLLQADRHKYHHRVSCPVLSHPGHV